MTQPTIGRIVHYVSYGSAGGEYKPACRAALVTEVREDDIGLGVINPTGLFFDRQVRESDEHTGGTWHWPCVITTEQEAADEDR